MKNSTVARTKRLELFGGLRRYAAIFVAAPWIASIWEASTGAEISTHRSIGQPSTPEHLRYTLKFAIVATIVGIALIVWCTKKLRNIARASSE